MLCTPKMVCVLRHHQHTLFLQRSIEGQSSHISIEVQNRCISIEGQNGCISNEGQNSYISIEGQSSHISIEGQNRCISNEGQSSHINIERQNRCISFEWVCITLTAEQTTLFSCPPLPKPLQWSGFLRPAHMKESFFSQSTHRCTLTSNHRKRNSLTFIKLSQINVGLHNACMEENVVLGRILFYIAKQHLIGSWLQAIRQEYHKLEHT